MCSFFLLVYTVHARTHIHRNNIAFRSFVRLVAFFSLILTHRLAGSLIHGCTWHGYITVYNPMCMNILVWDAESNIYASIEGINIKNKITHKRKFRTMSIFIEDSCFRCDITSCVFSRVSIYFRLKFFHLYRKMWWNTRIFGAY